MNGRYHVQDFLCNEFIFQESCTRYHPEDSVLQCLPGGGMLGAHLCQCSGDHWDHGHCSGPVTCHHQLPGYPVYITLIQCHHLTTHCDTQRVTIPIHTVRQRDGRPEQAGGPGEPGPGHGAAGDGPGHRGHRVRGNTQY